MKLQHISFENFRLLKDLELSFSTKPNKKLTVIRAENESGKTTILHGLQWVLFGDECLPSKDYRLHPIDWELSSGNNVDIRIDLEFEHTWIKTLSNGDTIPTTEEFIAIREATESLKSNNEWKRLNSSFTLYKKTDDGLKEFAGAELYLRTQILGSNLKDIFFTDGDRANKFITSEISASDKRKLVQKAIRDMLAFEILDNAIHHTDSARRDIRKKVRDFDADDQIARIANELSHIEEQILECDEKIEDLNEKIAINKMDLGKYNDKIEEALRKGDKEALLKILNANKSELERATTLLVKSKEKNSRVFRDETFSSILLSDHIEKTSSILEELNQKGKIPRTSIPVLQERLELEQCICGTPLTKGSKQYEYLVALIKDQEKNTEIDDRLSRLRYTATIKLENSTKDIKSIKEKIEEIEGDYYRYNQMIITLETDIKELDRQIDLLPDVDIVELRKFRKELDEIGRKMIMDRAKAEGEQDRLKRKLISSDRTYNDLIKQHGKSQRLRANLLAANDVLQLIKCSKDSIQENELPEVSKIMNSLFLGMIRSDPDQRAVIHNAQITADYEIIVLGPNKRRLDPDQDINGASRRALTLSFVLALTKVSGVEAPNVIDTPLGMMDPLIKQSVLMNAIDFSSQLVLFLTRSEIRDCEELLDEYGYGGDDGDWRKVGDTHVINIDQLEEPIYVPLVIVKVARGFLITFSGH